MLYFIVPFCSIFILVGGGLTIFAARKITQGIAAARWPHVEGVIQSVVSKDTSDSESSSREIQVIYTYQVAGRNFDGSVIHPAYSSSSFEEAHQGLEKALHADQKVRVYYAEGDPARSTLSVGFYSCSLALLFGGLAFLGGGICFLCISCFAIAGDAGFARGITLLE